VAYGEVSVKVIIIQVCFEPQSPKKCNLLFRRTGSWTLSFSGFFIAMQRLTQVEPSFWKAQPGVHFGAMDYSVGSRVRVKLYGGNIIEAKITAIVNQSVGRKIRISFGQESVVIDPQQIIEVLP
jgi:hypothetical protein